MKEHCIAEPSSSIPPVSTFVLMVRLFFQQFPKFELKIIQFRF